MPICRPTFQTASAGRAPSCSNEILLLLSPPESMRAMRLVGVVAVALLPLVAVLQACGGGEAALPSTFPEDFPLYPNLNIVRSSLLGDRYIIEADVEGSAQDVVDFYEQELMQGRWVLLGPVDSLPPNSKVLLFSAPGIPVNNSGKVIVTQDTGDGGRSVVTIEMPVEGTVGQQE